MTTLRACLFQTLQVFSQEDTPIDLGSPTGRSLFAYLLLNRSRPVDRRRLAFLFWPDGSESAARRNLRQYLHRIRRALEPVDPQGDLLLADSSNIQLNPTARIWLDVEAFRQGTRPESSLAELQQAAALYTGDLLEDVYEDWVVQERQALRMAYLSALERISQPAQGRGHWDDAIRYALKWVAAEPLDESAHRRLMTLSALSGDRSRAIQHYQSLAETLARELDTSPLPETQALAQSIQDGSIWQAHPPRQAAAQTSPINGNLGPRTREQTGLFEFPHPLPLIGREPELARLDEILRQASNGRGSFVLITGESGVGKTRLVQEYLDNWPDLPSLQSACHELESLNPYEPIRQALAEVVDLLPENPFLPAPAWSEIAAKIVPGLATRLPYLTPVETLTGADPQLPEAVTNLLLALCQTTAPQPIHLILDDLHWGDTSSWEMLAQLAQHAARNPIVILGLCRMEDLPPERGRLIRVLERNHLLTHLPLSRLSPAQTAELARQIIPDQEPDPLFLSRLYQETEGNPFFVIEIVRAASETGRQPSLPLDSSARSAPNLPSSIQRVIEARLDRLTSPSQELLATAAALGSTFTFSLLEEISQSQSEDIVAYIEEWSQRGLVREDSYGYDFSHDKIRQVAYANLSRARRQLTHRRIAVVLENAVPPADAATLAYHYARSDQPLKALPYLTQAGELALRSRSYLEARQFGLQAVNLLGRTPGPQLRTERIDLNLQLAQAYAFSGDLQRAQEILGETEHLATGLDDETRLGKVFHRSAQIFWQRGQPETAGDYARRTLRSAEELNDRALLEAALRMLGRVGIATAAFDDAIAYLVRYTNLANEHTVADLPVVLGYLGVAYSRVGSWGRAMESASRGVQLAESASSLNAPFSRANPSTAISFVRMQLAFVHADHSDWQTCQNLLEESPEVQDVMRAREAPGAALTPLEFMLHSLNGRILAHLGWPQQGIQIIRSMLDWSERADYRVFYYLPRLFLAESLLLAGQVEAAQAEAEIALSQGRAAGNRWAVGVIARLLAEIGTRLPNPNWPNVENHLIESMTLLRQVRARPDLARTYLALRRLYDRAGQIAWAVDCHFRATSIFEELGMGDELRHAQGQAAGERRGAVVIHGLALRGPNEALEKTEG